MKKILSLMLCLFVFPVLFGCSGDNNTDDKLSDDDSVTSFDIEISIKDESGTQHTVKADFAENISEFTLLRSDTASSGEKSALSKLKTAVKEKTGSDLAIKTDYSSVSPDSYQIVIGETKSNPFADEMSEMSEFDFAIKSSGNKIYIFAGSDEALDTAANVFIENFISTDGSSLCVPLGDGYKYVKAFKFGSIKIDGTDLSDYVIVYKTYSNDPNEMSRSRSVAGEIQAELLNNIIGKQLRVVSEDRLSNGEMYILVSADSTNVNDWSINCENGNITISGSYLSVNEAKNVFLSEYLTPKNGDEIDTTALSGSLSLNVPYSKNDMLELFEDVYNDDTKVISGGHTYGDNDEKGTNIKITDDRFLERTGKRAAILEIETGEYSSYNFWYNGTDTLTDEMLSRTVSEALDFVSDGGIISIAIHMANPLMNATDSVFYRGYLGDDDAAIEMLTGGTELNDGLRKTLEPTVRVLKAFKENGIPFMFRPLHEMNGGWFWWCVNQSNGETLSQNVMKEFWKFFHKLVTDELGIDNAVWVYAPNYNNGSCADVLYAYPGDEYVDLVGVDWYTFGNYEFNDNESYTKIMSTGKPAALTEVGPSESGMAIKDQSGNVIGYSYDASSLLVDLKTMMDDGYKLTYFLTWGGSISAAELDGGDVLMNDKAVMTLEDLAEYWEK